MTVHPRVKGREYRSLFLSFIFAFILMAAYYLLRPLRDAMVSDWTDVTLSTIWTAQFVLSLAIVVVYGFVVRNIRFDLLVPTIYLFFSLSFLAFYLYANNAENRLIVDRIFYLWMSVFSLFHLSVFWSFMSDLYSKDQAKRLFGFIAAGGSCGAIAGPIVPALLAGHADTYQLVLLSSFLIALIVPLIWQLQKLKIAELHNEQVHVDLTPWKIGGSLTKGFKTLIHNPYLLAISLFIFLYAGIGSFLYFEQKELLEKYSRSERESILGWIEVAVNTVTLIVSLCLTDRIIRKFGVLAALILLPILMFFALIALAISPMLMTLVIVQVINKAGNYSVTRPTREILFTGADRRALFETKPIIDIVAYRGGDMVMGWLYTGLTMGLGAGLVITSLVAAAIAVVWGFAGAYLGRWFNREHP